ncbi:MAG: PQQ-binding-like beta-propeller repeat protein [Caldisericia bacterium]|nr:PQQ-binding-like beta-propeller repeat protein [Caldisericia bacterium]
MGKRFINLWLIVSIIFSLFSFSFPAKSEQTCLGWPMFGRTPDGCHWVPADCSPKSSDYELDWTTDIKEYLLLRKLLVIGNRVITYGYSGTLYSYLANPQDHNPKLLWTYNLKSPMKTPCYDKGKLFICLESGRVECVDFATKNLLWTTTLSGFIDSHPVVYKDRLYVDSADQSNILNSKTCYFNCLDARTGRLIWKYDKMGRIFTTPAFDSNRMVVGTDKGSLYCFDTTKNNSDDGLVWSVKLGFKVYSPAIRNGMVYSITRDDDGSFLFTCMNLADGVKIWQNRVNKSGEYYDYVAVNDKYFLCDTLDGFVCLDALTGKRVWSNKELGFSATITDDYVFTATKKEVNCSDINTGKKLWSNPIKAPALPTTIDRDRIYLMGDNTIYTFKLKNPTYPELEDLGDSGAPGSDISKPARIIIKPDSIVMEPGTSQKFEAQVYDDKGQLIETDGLLWEVDGKAGTVDSEGVFTANKEGSCQIKCTCADITAFAPVTIVRFLKAIPESLRFDKVTAGSQKPYTANLGFVSQVDMTVDLQCSSPMLSLSQSKLELRAKNQTNIEVLLSAENLNPGQIIDAKITASYNNSFIEIPVQIVVSDQKGDCLSVLPGKLDFGYVARGTKKTISLAISSTRQTKIRIKPNANWIQLSTSSVELGGGESKTVEVTIQPSTMPTGKTFTGSIDIIDEQNFCMTVAVPVTIETDKGIVLELVIDSDKAKLNGKQVALDAPARIINGRTMVPIRFISESFGCKVEWDAKEGKVTIIRNDITIRLWKGKNTAKVNTEEKKLDSPPIIIKGRTFVPLRFISEPFGAVVAWDKVTKTITIVWDPL